MENKILQFRVECIVGEVLPNIAWQMGKALAKCRGQDELTIVSLGIFTVLLGSTIKAIEERTGKKMDKNDVSSFLTKVVEFGEKT